MPQASAAAERVEALIDQILELADLPGFGQAEITRLQQSLVVVSESIIAAPPPAPTHAPAGRLAIALVDDDPLSRRLFTKQFTRLGVRVTTFASGQEFVQLGSDRHWDMVVMDNLMPGMSGLETIRHLKQLRPVESPMCLFSSSSLEVDDQKTLSELGSEYVQKSKQACQQILSLLGDGGGGDHDDVGPPAALLFHSGAAPGAMTSISETLEQWQQQMAKGPTTLTMQTFDELLKRAKSEAAEALIQLLHNEWLSLNRGSIMPVLYGWRHNSQDMAYESCVSLNTNSEATMSELTDDEEQEDYYGGMLREPWEASFGGMFSTLKDFFSLCRSGFIQDKSLLLEAAEFVPSVNPDAEGRTRFIDPHSLKAQLGEMSTAVHEKLEALVLKKTGQMSKRIRQQREAAQDIRAIAELYECRAPSPIEFRVPSPIEEATTPRGGGRPARRADLLINHSLCSEDGPIEEATRPRSGSRAADPMVLKRIVEGLHLAFTKTKLRRTPTREEALLMLNEWASQVGCQCRRALSCWRAGQPQTDGF